jgi:hypothetical protein
MVVTLLLLFTGLLFSGYAFFLLLRRRRLLAAGVNGLISLPLLLAGGFFGMLLLNLQTYHQLTRESVLAEIRLGQPSSEGIPLHLKLADQEQTYNIRTQEWRLDARFVKWKPWLSLLGQDPAVRLERLEEREASGRGNTQLKSYDLVLTTAWVDKTISELSEKIGLVDSVYGSSVYMPAIPGAEYQVTASISGLVARPTNRDGRGAVIEWSRQ